MQDRLRQFEKRLDRLNELKDCDDETTASKPPFDWEGFNKLYGRGLASLTPKRREEWTAYWRRYGGGATEAGERYHDTISDADLVRAKELIKGIML